MSARGPKKGEREAGAGWWRTLRLDGLLQLAGALYLGLALGGASPSWLQVWRGTQDLDLFSPANPGGPIGALAALLLRAILGAAWCWAVPLLLLNDALWRLASGRPAPHPALKRSAGMWLASAAWLAQPSGPLPPEAAAVWGGAAGYGLGAGAAALLGLWGARIILSGLMLTALAWGTWPVASPLVRALAPLARLTRAIARGLWLGAAWSGRSLARAAAWLGGAAAALSGRLRREGDERTRRAAPAAAAAGRARGGRRVHLPAARAPAGQGEAAASAGASDAEPRRRVRSRGPAAPQAQPAAAEPAPAPALEAGAPAADIYPELRPRSAAAAPCELPDLDLLREPPATSARQDAAALNAAADLLEGTLRSFGVEGEVKDVRPGPVVTTFEYQPAAGIKISQIVQRADDLALAMRARSIRMEAPIPGKAAVGIEIPNAVPQLVVLKDVLARAGDRLRAPLAVALGKDVVGQPVAIDIARLPHLLVAGSTGSGKSVCLNGIICNLLLRNDPARVRLLLIDPKMLEMNVYNGIPHLLLPVITDPKEALRALRWLEAQMDHRYRRLARHGVRDIEGYNARVARGEIVDEEGAPIGEPMPYYLAIVDELADLMLQLGQEFELPVTRLAQKARAVGIHLILATQRPSVNVLTGVIKANMPCRIAFRVIQKNDSRTILDLNGAEKLLGHGDMLYLMPGRATPLRVHGAYIDLEECERIVAHWRRYADRTQTVALSEERGEAGDVTGEDELFEAAKRVVVLHQSGSTSLLQRRLRIGYTRAGRLMDMLEEAGVVGPFTGSKARDVLLRPDDLEPDGGLLAREEQE